jgi:integrase
MGRGLNRLSAVQVKAITGKGMHPDGGGLYLQVTAGGAKSWIFRFMLNHRAREMGLGPIDAIPLAEARKRAAECRRMRYDGIDPIEARRAERDQKRLEAARAMTFDACAAVYINAHKTSWKNAKHRDQWSNTLKTYASPVFGALPVQSIDPGLVMKALEPIWSEKPETASRVRGRIETVLDWATVSGYRQGENPARWRGHLDHLLPAPSKAKRAKRRATGKGEHYAAMAFDLVPAFVAELREREAISARALEFTILTAKRTGEVIGARDREFSLTDRVWTIPAGRMKGEREHRVPLSSAAVAVLEKMGVDPVAHPDRYAFPGAKPDHPLSDMAMLNLLQHRMGNPEVTVHGFRSSLRDWGAERTDFPNEVLEMALAHVIDDKTEAAYRRGDLLQKRRQLMEAWAKFCETPTVPAEVVPLRAASQRQPRHYERPRIGEAHARGQVD